MRTAFRWLTSVLFAAIVVQVGFAGYAAFDAIHKAEKAPISKKTIEDGFNAHGAVGTLIVLIMLALLIVSLVGRLGESYLKWSGGIFLLGILQFILDVASTSVPCLGFLHAVNALAIYAAVALLAHRVWTKAARKQRLRQPRRPPKSALPSGISGRWRHCQPWAYHVVSTSFPSCEYR